MTNPIPADLLQAARNCLDEAEQPRTDETRRDDLYMNAFVFGIVDIAESLRKIAHPMLLLEAEKAGYVGESAGKSQVAL